LLCGSINVRERPWASKRQPIDYKRCCTDRLNAHLDNGLNSAVTRPPIAGINCVVNGRFCLFLLAMRKQCDDSYNCDDQANDKKA
jgi:hypothetical protein